MPDHGAGPRKKNGPALAGHGAGAVRDAITKSIQALPGHLCKSLTWDQGAEMAQYAKLRTDTGLPNLLLQPARACGSNESTKGLLQQSFPKGTDLCAHDETTLVTAVSTLNNRPGKIRGWKTPAEALGEVLS